jgi:hypothetical protein
MIVLVSFVSFMFLYFVIKAAVRDGIVEARGVRKGSDPHDRGKEDHIEQVTCPQCGKRHDMDYPKGPYCNPQY